MKTIGLLLIGLVIIFGCIRRSTNYPETMPNDFNFISNIANSSYILDTYNNKLTKTIDWKLDTTIAFELSLSEKQKIYKILKEIDIYKYPGNYTPVSKVKVFPTLSYQFEFTLNRVDYKINWNENTESDTKDAKELRNLFLEIQNKIEKSDRVKELPESKRAFL
ncbi:MAG: hypothetical protein HOO86_15805 [Bacteroidales bacterium]|nr:hypothetical protein [Bacteroidales bacterium]